MEKYEELLSIFPTISPQYLKKQVLAVSRVKGPQDCSREVTKDLHIAFQSRVEGIWSMTPETQWELQKKEQEELEKWSGKIYFQQLFHRKICTIDRYR